MFLTQDLISAVLNPSSLQYDNLARIKTNWDESHFDGMDTIGQNGASMVCLDAIKAPDRILITLV